MPYCPECGKEVTDDTDFCPHCGAKLRETEVTYRRPRGELPVVCTGSSPAPTAS